MRRPILGIPCNLLAFTPAAAVRSAFVSPIAVAWILMATSAGAAILRVEADGSGDYPTIQAAFDAAAEGDVVELGDGTFTGPANVSLYMPVPLTLRSGSGDPEACLINGLIEGGGGLGCDGVFTLQGISFVAMEVSANNGVVQNCIFRQGSILLLWSFEGPPLIESCRFLDNHLGASPALVVAGSPHVVDCWFEGNSAQSGGAIFLEDRTGDALFERCTFVSNEADWGGVIAVLERFNHPVFRNCTFYENSAVNGGAIAALGGLPPQSVTFENCILMNSRGSEPVSCAENTSVAMVCSISYGNEFGDFPACMSGLEVGFDNISADPLFCDPENGDFRVEIGSPAAPYEPPNETCDLIGSHWVGCGDPASVPELASSAVGVRVTALPNPGTASTRLRITVPGAADSPVVLVTDVGGRRIRSLEAVKTGDGVWESLWDGRDDDGAPAGAGVFFARVSLGDEEVQARIVRLR